MSIDVRDTTMDDLAICNACLDQVAREGLWLSRLTAPPFDRYAAFRASLRDANAPQIVAIDGAVVGWCDVAPDPAPVRAHVGILGIGLLASHRRRGLGKRLLTIAIDRAYRKSFVRIQLSVLNDDDAARMFARGSQEGQGASGPESEPSLS